MYIEQHFENGKNEFMGQKFLARYDESSNYLVEKSLPLATGGQGRFDSV